MSKVEEQRPVLSVEECAELLGISRYLAYKAVREGELPSLRIGYRLLIPRAALERLLTQQPKQVAVT